MKTETRRKLNFAPLLLFGAALLWSFNGLFTKSVDWDGMSLATLRGLIAFPLMSLLLFLRNRKLSDPPRLFTLWNLLGGLCYVLQALAGLSSYKFTTAANAVVLGNTSSFFVILLNRLILRKLPTKKETLVCLILVFGVALAFCGNLGPGGALGNILALVCSFFYAGVFFCNKMDGADSLSSLVLGNSLFLLLIPYMVTRPAFAATTGSEWAFLLVMATLSGFTAWFLFSQGIRGTSALGANFITISEPVMGPVWAYLLLNERISPLSLVGCALVLVTILVYNVSKTKSGEE